MGPMHLRSDTDSPAARRVRRQGRGHSAVAAHRASPLGGPSHLHMPRTANPQQGPLMRAARAFSFPPGHAGRLPGSGKAGGRRRQLLRRKALLCGHATSSTRAASCPTRQGKGASPPSWLLTPQTRSDRTRCRRGRTRPPWGWAPWAPGGCMSAVSPEPVASRGCHSCGPHRRRPARHSRLRARRRGEGVPCPASGPAWTIGWYCGSS